MKFCPNCGSILEEKIKCNCGYDTVTGKVDENMYKDFKNNEKSLYEQSCDNMSLMSGINQYDVAIGAKMMGMKSNLSNEEILNQLKNIIKLMAECIHKTIIRYCEDIKSLFFYGKIYI